MPSLRAIPIAGAAVFLNADVQLTVDNPDIPALRADQVKEYVRARVRDVKLKPSTLREVTAFLTEQADYQDEAEEK